MITALGYATMIVIRSLHQALEADPFWGVLIILFGPAVIASILALTAVSLAAHYASQTRLVQASVSIGRRVVERFDV